jgi:predicted nucleic acid-binding protein
MRIYACSGVFIAHLRGNEEFSAASSDIMDAAHSELIELHTSFLTITEVIASERSLLRRTGEDENKVTALMDSQYILYSALDQIVAEMSRWVSWDFRIKPADAVHLATAVIRKCETLFTVDTKLIARSGGASSRVVLPIIKVPELIVRQPQLPLKD